MSLGGGMTSLGNRTKLVVGVGETQRSCERQVGSGGRLCAGEAPALEPMVGYSACLFHTYSSEHV